MQSQATLFIYFHKTWLQVTFLSFSLPEVWREIFLVFPCPWQPQWKEVVDVNGLGCCLMERLYFQKWLYFFGECEMCSDKYAFWWKMNEMFMYRRKAFSVGLNYVFCLTVAHPQEPHHPTEKPVIHCHKCGEPCKGEVLRVQSRHFHIKCFTCKGKTWMFIC